MEFAFNEEQNMLIDMVRDFAQEQVAPKAAGLDKEAAYPSENLRKMAELGLMGVTIPTDLEGAEMDTVSYCLAVEEIGRACASTAAIMVSHNSQVLSTIYKFGSDDHKKKYLPDLAAGKKLGAFAFSEPDESRDLSRIGARVKKEGNYMIDGKKTFVINGHEAELFVLFASLDGAKSGMCCFVVEKGTPGLKIGPKLDILGLRASGTCDLEFENCAVPPENLIGTEGQGFEIASNARDMGRLGISAMAVGIAQGAFETSLAYSQDRRQFGQPIFNFHMIQAMLVQMAAEIESARLMVYKTAWLKDQGRDITKEAAMTKLLACDIAVRSTINGVQVHGGYGYTKEYPLERNLRDAKVAQLLEGTSEEQKLVIAQQLVRT